MLALAVDNKCS